MKAYQILYFFLFTLILSSCSHTPKTVIAHRSASGYLPEHTLAGVAMAHGWGVDYIEPDVVLTKDNQAVILHDIYIDTTTNVKEVFPRRMRKDGRFYAIDFTLKEIKKLKVHERVNTKTGKRVFPKRFPLAKGHFEVPTLIEFIELVQGLNKSRNVDIGIYPELKSPEFHQKEKKDIAKTVLKILDDYGYNHEKANIYLQCFYYPTLKRLRKELGAKMPLVALIAENSWKESSLDYEFYQSKKGLKELASFVNGIGPYALQLYRVDKVGRKEVKPLAKLAKDLGLVIHPYTHRKDQLPPGFSSDKEFFEYFYETVKVDGFFSDFGDLALKYSK